MTINSISDLPMKKWVPCEQFVQIHKFHLWIEELILVDD
jgi:hypothetical protein